MIYNDCVYGNVNIDEKVLLDLIESPSLQRLKGIDQAGYIGPYYPGTKHSRFDHSVGVMCLLRIYGASLEEQIAGLIHDVSHSAFSHCIDYILEGGSEETHSYQDDIAEEFVKRSEIVDILNRHDIDINFILDDRNFPLKEKDLPDLCADRIDYSLRRARFSSNLASDVEFVLDKLKAVNGMWVFDDYPAARKYAEIFFELNSKYFSGFPSAIMFRTVGDCMRYALKAGYITEGDLYTTDDNVIGKLKTHSSDPRLKVLFDRMEGKIEVHNNPNNYDAVVTCKSRVVDPLCFYGGKVKRVSDIDPSWKDVVKTEKRPKKYFLKFS